MRREQAEDLLRALVEGEPVDPSRVETAFAEHPDLEREWREIQAIQSCLRDAPEVRRAVLETASALVDAPGAEQAEKKLRELIASGTPVRIDPQSLDTVAADRGRPRPLSRWPWILVAAALLVTSLIVLRRATEREEPTRQPILLGSDRPVPKAMPKARRSGLSFEWASPLPPDASFEIVLEGREDEAAPWKELAPRPHPSGTSWSPDAATVASWPRFLRWKVIAHASDQSGSRESGWSETELLP